MVFWAIVSAIVGAAIILSFELILGKQNTETETSG